MVYPLSIVVSTGHPALNTWHILVDSQHNRLHPTAKFLCAMTIHTAFLLLYHVPVLSVVTPRAHARRG